MEVFDDSKTFFPIIVNVLPLPVYPYKNTVEFIPFKEESTISLHAVLNIYSL